VTELLRTQPDILQQVLPCVPLPPGGRIPGHQPDPVLVAAVTCAIPPQHLPLRGRRRSVPCRGHSSHHGGWPRLSGSIGRSRRHDHGSKS
jgi:hypothetical protein